MGYTIRHSQAYLLAMRNQVRGISSGIGAPSAPGVVQQNFPTSAYGQTIPVLYGKARVPGAYVWAPDIEVTTNTFRVAFEGEVTTTERTMDCRVRFGAPLVPDSEWTLRRLWADGRKIYDASTGYRWSGLRFRFYDGRSTQERDPTMVDEEGESNVSAHRGYIDIVIRDFDIGEASSPPVFEAEVVQGDASDYSTSNFTAFFADAVGTVPAADWDEGTFYGYSATANLIRKFSIGDLREVYAVPLSGLVGTYAGWAEGSFRYFPTLDRLMAFGFVAGLSGGTFPVLIDPVSGIAVAEAAAPIGAAGQLMNIDAAFMIGDKGVLVAASFHLGYLSTYKFTASTIERVSLSATSWDARGVPQCITVGTVSTASATVWICAGTKLYKCTVTIGGLITSVSEHATFVDDPIYAVWYDDDVIVWTDNAEAIRIHGTTGATVWTKSVPYQVESSAETRSIAPPDHHRFGGTLFFQRSTSYDFTNLGTGDTASVAKSSGNAFRYAYDSEADWLITTDNAAMPTRTVFEVGGAGTTRNLSDFLEDLTVHGGGFDPSEVQVIGVDDVIEGAVIDVTSGVREVVRSIADPYSFAIHER